MSKKPKKKGKFWKIFRRILCVLLILGLAGGGYWYYAFEYRASHEVETERTTTSTEPLYTEEEHEKTVSRNKVMASYLADGTAAETSYVIPGLEATRTLKIRTTGTPDMCTSMTPQGLAVTEDYLLISAHCRTKEHNSVIYVLDKETH